MLHDETRQVRRLDKIDQMQSDLEAARQQVYNQGTTMKDLAEKAKESFADFNDAREANLEALKADLDLKENEMKKLADDTKAKNEQNDHHIDKIQSQRKKDELEGNKANPDCLRAVNNIADLEKALDRAREQNRADLEKTRQLKGDFDKLKD